jgi:calnexin
MQNDILFDNIYIGHSVEDAAKLKSETFDIKHPIEEAEDEATKPKPDTKPSSPMDLVFKDDPVKYVREKLDLFVTIAKRDPLEAIKFMPEVAGGIGAVLVTVLAIIIGLVSVGSGSPQVHKAAEKSKGAAADAKDKAAEAVTSGAETAKAEVNKRTTRSSGFAEQ